MTKRHNVTFTYTRRQRSRINDEYGYHHFQILFLFMKKMLYSFWILKVGNMEGDKIRRMLGRVERVMMGRGGGEGGMHRLIGRGNMRYVKIYNI